MRKVRLRNHPEHLNKLKFQTISQPLPTSAKTRTCGGTNSSTKKYSYQHSELQPLANQVKMREPPMDHPNSNQKWIRFDQFNTKEVAKTDPEDRAVGRSLEARASPCVSRQLHWVSRPCWHCPGPPTRSKLHVRPSHANQASWVRSSLKGGTNTNL